MSGIDLVITYDTEDVYAPASAGMNDIPKRLAEIMSAEGVQANFMMLASRATLLKERGRQGVIAALTRHANRVDTRRHDQPYHSYEPLLRHAQHPLPPRLAGDAATLPQDVHDKLPCWPLEPAWYA